MLVLTREAAQLQKVPHELGLGEEKVIHLIHTELVDLVDVLLPIQILMKGLDFS